MPSENAEFLYGDQKGDRYLRVIRIFYRYHFYTGIDIIRQYNEFGSDRMKYYILDFFSEHGNLVKMMTTKFSDETQKELILDLASAYADLKEPSYLVYRLLDDMEEAYDLIHHPKGDPSYPYLTFLAAPLGIDSYYDDADFDLMFRKISSDLPRYLQDHRRPKKAAPAPSDKKRLFGMILENVSSLFFLKKKKKAAPLPKPAPTANLLENVPENPKISALKNSIQKNREKMHYPFKKRIGHLLLHILYLCGIGFSMSFVLSLHFLFWIFALLAVLLLVNGVRSLIDHLIIDRDGICKDLTQSYQALLNLLTRKLYWGDIFLAYYHDRLNTPEEGHAHFSDSSIYGALRRYMKANTAALNDYYRKALEDCPSSKLPIVDCPKYLHVKPVPKKKQYLLTLLRLLTGPFLPDETADQ